MDSVLLVSSSQKGTAFFTEILSAASDYEVRAVSSCGEARRLLLEMDFDLVIVNAPLSDESGEEFSRYVALKEISQIILVVRSELYEAVSAACEADGVLSIAKPINRNLFWAAVSFAKSARNRIQRMQTENAKLKQRIEDIRIVDRAKCILIAYMNMGENEAHHYIEKQAMDRRCTKRVIAEDILKKYEN